MILQALTSLYEALAPKGEVPKEGWSREKISFALGIDENGDLLRITPLFKPGVLDRILFETDCPYMAPEPIRGLECEPAMISITANALVNDRVDRTGEDAETIAQAAWENACKLFQK